MASSAASVARKVVPKTQAEIDQDIAAAVDRILQDIPPVKFMRDYLATLPGNLPTEVDLRVQFTALNQLMIEWQKEQYRLAKMLAELGIKRNIAPDEFERISREIQEARAIQGEHKLCEGKLRAALQDLELARKELAAEQGRVQQLAKDALKHGQTLKEAQDAAQQYQLNFGQAQAQLAIVKGEADQFKAWQAARARYGLLPNREVITFNSALGAAALAAIANVQERDIYRQMLQDGLALAQAQAQLAALKAQLAALQGQLAARPTQAALDALQAQLDALQAQLAAEKALADQARARQAAQLRLARLANREVATFNAALLAATPAAIANAQERAIYQQMLQDGLALAQAQAAAAQLAALQAQLAARPTQAALDALQAQLAARPTQAALDALQAQLAARPTQAALDALQAQLAARPTQAALDALQAQAAALRAREQDLLRQVQALEAEKARVAQQHQQALAAARQQAQPAAAAASPAGHKRGESFAIRRNASPQPK